jgi:hypothetical protein
LPEGRVVEEADSMRDRTPSQPVRFQAVFVGGHFDGHVMWLAETPVFISVFVNENMFLALSGKPRGAWVPAISVAVYEQRERAGKLYYHVYRHSLSPRHLHAQRWRG